MKLIQIWYKYTREISAIIENLISENQRYRKNHAKRFSFKTATNVASDSSDSDSDSEFQIPRETVHDPLPPANKVHYPLRAEKRAKLLAEAYKISKDIVTLEASADNIEAWVPASFNALREVFPSLSCGDVLKVLCKRLPKDEVAYIERITLGVERVDVFCDILKSVFGKGCRRGEQNFEGLNSFFNFKPSIGKAYVSVHKLVWEILKKSDCLVGKSPEEKDFLVISKIISYLPHSFREEVRRNQRAQKGDSVFNILAPILTAEARADIDHALKNYSETMIPLTPHLIGRVEVGEEPVLNVAEPEKRNPPSCGKCGIGGHSSENCPIWVDFCKEPCSTCSENFKTRLFHPSDKCYYKAKEAPPSGKD